jgi:hypothetical protein
VCDAQNLVLELRLFAVLSALQSAAAADAVGEGGVPRRRTAQLPYDQRASVAGGWSNGASGEVAAITAAGAAVCRARVSGTEPTSSYKWD